MKLLLSTFVFLLLSACFSPTTFADPANKVVLHLNTPEKMTMLVNNVKNLRATLGKDADIVVVVNGPAVARFSTLAESRDQLDELLDANVEVAICSYAMKNRNILQIELLKGTTYLKDGGVAKLVALQQAGYAYIKP